MGSHKFVRSHLLDMPRRFRAKLFADHAYVGGTIEVNVKGVITKSQHFSAREMLRRQGQRVDRVLGIA